MRHHILSIILLAAACLPCGCIDDEIPVEQEQVAPGESPLQFAVTAYDVKAEAETGTRASIPNGTPEAESAEEKRIHDFWLFTFDAAGNQIAAPAYYEPNTADETLKSMAARAYEKLPKNTPMTLYVVTNTQNPTWAKGTGFDTLEGVKAQKLPSPAPIRAGFDDVLIPMCGQLDNVNITADEKKLWVIPVTRMYAKVKVQVNFGVDQMRIYDVNITGIPWYCRVSTIATALDENGEPLKADCPEGTYFVSRAFRSTDAVTDEDGSQWLVLYVPEIIRGENDNEPGANKTNVGLIPENTFTVPENALTVEVRAKYNGMDFYYTVYPGGNDYNNFNIQRNCVYRVTSNVTNATDQHTPSSNCFVVAPGETLQFEPYYRVEKGGGYDIATYLDPAVTDKTIDTVDIVWQTPDCIGDNSKGDLVYLGDDTGDIHRKIIVKAGKEGNALIAARNSKEQIIWSWHIWVTPNEPDNRALAHVYTTFTWDENGIYGGKGAPRIPGYAIMPCNLGALDFTGISRGTWPKRGDLFNESERRTFGMTYQWGRKDPFPPVIRFTEGSAYRDTIGYNNFTGEPILGNKVYYGILDYTEENTGIHYRNDNKTHATKSNTVNGTELFHSIVNSKNTPRTVEDGIRNPTVYIGCSDNTTTNEYGGNDSETTGPWWRPTTTPDNLRGDWLWNHDSKLWGGLDPETPGLKKRLIGQDGNKRDIYLYDNYGTQKSIFDPCPTGWRVAPPDLWLGFTETGGNPASGDYFDKVLEDVNWEKSISGLFGMAMFMQAWHDGPTSYFPLQGTRINAGMGYSTGFCGNYHNATCSKNDRVNILHLHQSALRFHIFEIDDETYYTKATASPIRCVRDRK